VGDPTKGQLAHQAVIGEECSDKE